MSQPLTLIGDEARDAALLIGDEASQHGNEAFVDLGSKFEIAGKRFTRLHEHPGKVLLQHLALAACASLKEGAGIRPHGPRQFAKLGPRQKIALQSVDARRVGLVGG